MPPIVSSRMPVTNMPIGWRPIEIVRAVLPTRPSRRSGVTEARYVRYETIVKPLPTPADERAAQEDHSGSADRQSDRR